MIVDGKTGFQHPTLKSFSVEVQENLIAFKDCLLYSGDGTRLNLTFSADKSHFTAQISQVYNSYMRDVDGEAVRMVVALFTEIYQDTDFNNMLLTNFRKDSGTCSFSATYGGYSLTIEIEEYAYCFANITIIGSKT